MSKTEHSSGVTKLPRVIIVGGGFGGLAAAKVLAKAPVQVVLIDKVNHSLFQPLLYQVAGSMLDAGDIAFPIRGEFRKEKNVIVAMAEVTGIDKDERCVYVTNWPRPIEYDYLVLATGVEGSYFGHDEWAPHAPGMKTLSDAIRLRSRILEAFEDAELQEDPRAHPEFTTFVLVGAGPTGCELAGTLAEMFRETLKSEFRRFDPEMARIIVVEAGPRVLPMFSPGLSEKALLKLERMGVEVRLGHPVEQVDAEGVTIAGERIRTRTVIWTAGVTATPVGRWLAVETDSDGTGQGRPLPGVAPVALQSGRYAGKVIARRVAGEPALPPFAYLDKGILATVARNYALLESGPFKLSGPIAKLAWAFVHIFYLMENEDRVVVFVKWMYAYFTRKRGTRIIEDSCACE